MDENGKQFPVPKERLMKCFGYLIVIRFAAAVLPLLSMVPYVGGFADYLGLVLTFVKIWILGGIGGRGTRYSRTAMLLLISVVAELIGGFLPLMGLQDALGDIYNVFATALTLIASLCSFLAMYQEYNAHAELIEPVDPDLARRWHKLFNWQIVYLLAAYVVSVVLIAVLFVFPLAIHICNLCLKLINIVFAWCYIQNLNAMLKRLS